jgi:NAD(P)-dependent dehydrogenase (short-subunit alcohol dehydrogenase family)
MKSFDKRVAAITGAGSGIGRALAVELAQSGCHLALSDVNDKGLAETARQAARGGIQVSTLTVDVAQRGQVHAWAEEAVRTHGKVNLIFNNAGVAMGGTVEGSDYADYEWMMGINFWGVVYGTKAFLPHLKAAGEGHIVNVSSVFGLIAQPTQSAYNSAKFAVRGFTESLRQELDLERCGVSATCVHPGGIKTNIARNARMSKSVDRLIPGGSDRARQNFEKLFRTSPEAAARKILAGVRCDARRVLIGPDAYVIDTLQRLAPAVYQNAIRVGMHLMN